MINKLLQITRILTLSCLIGLSINIGNASAKFLGISCKHSEYCGFMEGLLSVEKGRQVSSASYVYEKFDTDEIKKEKETLKNTEDKIKSLCKKINDSIESDFMYRDQGCIQTQAVEDYDIYLDRFTKILSQYPELENEYNQIEAEHSAQKKKIDELVIKHSNEFKSDVEAGKFQPCGPQHPYGCPEGTSCFWEKPSVYYSVNRDSAGGDATTTVTKKPVCLEPGSKKAKELTPVQQGEETFIETQIVSNYADIHTKTDETGKTEDLSNDYKHRGDNSKCDIAEMQQKYQGSCYSCKIILTLITTFMNACSKVYDISRDAGGKVLVIGAMLWLAAFALKLVSSFTNQEPMSILNDFFIFMFKVTAAYLMLNAGVAIIVNMFINPLLMAGADYGLGLLQAANKNIINVATTTSYAYNGTEVISAKVINKLMALTQGIDKTVATNLVIGHALTCHSFNAGMIHLGTSLFGVDVSLRIPDIWIWLCGASIWFCGFMLTLGVGYYLLDVCFKIGFCIIALPIVIGLWPFKMTEGKFKSCMSIILHSAGLFAFLALTVSYALTLISASLGDVSVFYAKIKAGDHEWISNTFSISGKQFILIMFAYVYGIKMIGATVTGYLGKFFGDNVFGSESPMHGKATQMTDFAKKKVTQAASFAGEVVTHQATRAVGAVAGGATRAVKGGVNKAKAALSKDKDKDNDGDGSKQKSNE